MGGNDVSDCGSIGSATWRLDRGCSCSSLEEATEKGLPLCSELIRVREKMGLCGFSRCESEEIWGLSNLGVSDLS